MSEENRKTIEVYEKFGAEYLARNESDIENNLKAKADDEYQRETLIRYTKDLPRDAKIFEVGSANGRDAKTLQSVNFQNIQTSDVAEFFLNKLREEGFSPIKFNLITDEFPEKYDFILCWAVLVHFKKDEAIATLRKMYEALNENGKLAFCVKYSDEKSEEWADFKGKIGAKRYFSYFKEDEIREILEEIGFSSIEIVKRDGARAGWLNVLVKKS